MTRARPAASAPHVTLLGSPRGGKYPDGRPLLVAGRDGDGGDRPVARPGRPGGRCAAGGSRAQQPLPRGPRRREPPVSRGALAPAGGRPARHRVARRLDGDLRLRRPGASRAGPASVVEQFHFTPRPDATGVRRRRRLRPGRRPHPRDPRARPHARPLVLPHRARRRALPRRHRSLELRPLLRRRLVVARRLRAHARDGARASRARGTRRSTTSACSTAARRSSSGSTASRP